MNRADLFNEISTIALEQFDWRSKLTAELRLVEDLELDSLKLLTLAMAVEDRFRICLDEDDEATITTVGDLVTLVEAKLGDSAGVGTGEEPGLA